MGDRDRLSFEGRPVPSRFRIRRIALAPGVEHDTEAGEWTDSLVVVESGSVEVVCHGGSRRTFSRGDILCLSLLPLRALRNAGPNDALLIAVRRSTNAGDQRDPNEDGTMASVQMLREGHTP
jgi:hypothetical protein